MKVKVLLAILGTAILAGCGGQPPVVHAAQPGQLYRLYSDQTPCGPLCSPPRVSPGYWLIDQGAGTPVQFFEKVNIQANATAPSDSFIMVFNNAVLTIQSDGNSNDNIATLTQGPE